MIADAIRLPLKRSLFLHAAYKLIRDFQNIPVSARTKISVLHDIFRVLPKTMLPMPRLVDLYDIVKEVNANRISGA